MKPLGPKKAGSIASTPAHKYLSHQWQKDLLTIIMSFVSQIEVVCEKERGKKRAVLNFKHLELSREAISDLQTSRKLHATYYNKYIII